MNSLLKHTNIFYKQAFIPQTRLNLVCGISLLCRNNSGWLPISIKKFYQHYFHAFQDDAKTAIWTINWGPKCRHNLMRI
jgi:hypothetical protein